MDGQTRGRMTRRQAELLLAAVIVARSSSYVFNKLGLGSMGPFNLLAVRFLLAFALLLPLFWRRLRHIGGRTLLRGAALGGLFFLVMTGELFALQTTPTGTVSLLQNMAILFVPLLEGLLQRRLPDRLALLSAAVALLGVALLTMQGGGLHLTGGEWIALCSALLYACAILCTDRFSHRDDGLVLGVLQVGFLGLFALLASLLVETPHLPDSGGQWAILVGLALVCTCFGYTLQPVAQSGTSAQRAGLFCALSPAFATLLGALLLHERITLTGGAGMLLILGSILLPRLPAISDRKQQRG